MTPAELREKVAQRIDKMLDGDCGYGIGEPLADALMPLFREAQAEAWDEGAQWAAVECGAITDERNRFVAPGENPYRKDQA